MQSKKLNFTTILIKKVQNVVFHGRNAGKNTVF
jgi:hypothetical protein